MRVTARWDEADLGGVFAVMHEVGHGLYEAGIDPALDRTTLGTGVSLGIHESQSRTWENQVGRSDGPSGATGSRARRSCSRRRCGDVELERLPPRRSTSCSRR